MDGARWKISNGGRISVWGDPWLSGPSPGRVISPCSDANKETTLDSIIDAIKRQWQVKKVESSFLPFEARKILSIPLKARNFEDELCWAYSKDDIL